MAAWLQRFVHFELWRWAFFFCGFTPIWYIANYFIHFLTIAVESRFFPFKQVLYYLVSIRVSCCLVSLCIVL